MTLTQFEREVFAAAMDSTVCGIPSVRRLSASAIQLRVGLTAGGFIEAFYNEATGTTAYALIAGAERLFGADNTRGWHVHPFADPTRHDPLPEPMAFHEFVACIEEHLADPT